MSEEPHMNASLSIPGRAKRLRNVLVENGDHRGLLAELLPDHIGKNRAMDLDFDDYWHDWHDFNDWQQ